MDFKELHQQEAPLLLCNVWDIASVKAAETAGFQAVGTSSAAMASATGYTDGHAMPFELLLEQVATMVPHTSLPFSVDLEGGYADDPEDVVRHMVQLATLGVVGINLEDSLVGQERQLQPATAFARKIQQVKALLAEQETSLFLNIRTDPFILGVAHPLAATLERIGLYEAAGADGIFIPGITSRSDIDTVTRATGLPINVMCMPHLPAFDILRDIGVKRISMGNFVHQHQQQQLIDNLRTIRETQSCQSLF